MAIEEIKVPIFAESITEGNVLGWHKKIGETVQEGEKLVDIETDKIVLEIVAPQSGLLIEILKTENQTVTSEELLGRIDTEAKQATSQQPQKVQPTLTVEPIPVVTKAIPPSPPKQSSAAPKTSPAVRKIAAEQGIDLATVAHQGDRITKTDLLQPPAKPTAPESPPLLLESNTSSTPSSDRPEERVPMTRIRKRIAERLLNAQQEHAILTTFNEINMKAVSDLRAKHRDEFEKRYGIRLGFMSFFAKAAIAALKKFPVVNASIDGDDVVYHGYYDLGIAVSSPRGLVVPIIRDADLMSFAELEKKINELGKRARDAQLSIEELTGGTFSITNGGIFGSMMSTPILNPPQSAILGMHNIVDRPVAENGQVVIRPVMFVALSYDHRLIDGRDAVQFLVAIKNAVEDPTRLLLDI